MNGLDRLPEYTQYHDEGCELNASCLRCPFSQCRFDDPDGRQTGPRAYRDEEIRTLRQEGMTIAALALRFGLSTRTVHRVLAKKDEACSL